MQSGASMFTTWKCVYVAQVLVCSCDRNVAAIENNFENWSRREVSKWLRACLRKNKFENEVIDSFIEEFDKKFINGKVLLKMKQKSEFIDSLILQFSEKNQGFGV